MSDERVEVLRLLTVGALRVNEALDLLGQAPGADDLELRVQQISSGQKLLSVSVSRVFVEAAGAAGLHLRLRAGAPPLAIAWRDLAKQLAAGGRAEVVDEGAGVVARLVGPGSGT